MIKLREVRIAKKVKRSDAADVSPEAMFLVIVSLQTHFILFAREADRKCTHNK